MSEPNFGADQFIDRPDNPVIYQQIGYGVEDTPQEKIDRAKAEGRKEPLPQQFVLTYKPISFSPRDGREELKKFIQLNYDKKAELKAHRDTFAAAVGEDPRKFPNSLEDWNRFNGVFFEAQPEVLPSYAKSNMTSPPKFWNVKRIVEQAEAEAVAASRVRPNASATAAEETQEAEDETQTQLLALVGDGGTQDEIKARYREQGIQNSTLWAGLVRGKLLDRGVSDGLLVKDGDRFTVA